MGVVQLKPITTRQPGPHPAGRRCPYPGCPTILHRFNDGPTCHVHEVTAFAAALVSEHKQGAA